MILRTEKTKPHLVRLALNRRRMGRSAYSSDPRKSAVCYAIDDVKFIEYRDGGRLVARQSFIRDRDFLDRWLEVLSGSFYEGMGD